VGARGDATPLAGAPMQGAAPGFGDHQVAAAPIVASNGRE
jgi:hypothetical protein